MLYFWNCWEIWRLPPPLHQRWWNSVILLTDKQTGLQKKKSCTKCLKCILTFTSFLWIWTIVMCEDDECTASSLDRARGIFSFHTYPHMHKQEMRAAAVRASYKGSTTKWCKSEGRQEGQTPSDRRGEILTIDHFSSEHTVSHPLSIFSTVWYEQAERLRSLSVTRNWAVTCCKCCKAGLTATSHFFS